MLKATGSGKNRKRKRCGGRLGTNSKPYVERKGDRRGWERTTIRKKLWVNSGKTQWAAAEEMEKTAKVRWGQAHRGLHLTTCLPVLTCACLCLPVPAQACLLLCFLSFKNREAMLFLLTGNARGEVFDGELVAGSRLAHYPRLLFHAVWVNLGGYEFRKEKCLDSKKSEAWRQTPQYHRTHF